MLLQAYVCTVVGILALSCTFQSVMSQSETDSLKNMAETLKILEQLNRYYSQILKPSPHGEVTPDMKYLSEIQQAVHKVRLRELDRKYLQRTRPRFGKRSEYPEYQERFLKDERVQVPEQQFWDPLVR